MATLLVLSNEGKSPPANLRLLAWAALKSQRGQRVVQHRLIAMQRAAQ